MLKVCVREKNECLTLVEDTIGQGSRYSFMFLFSTVCQVKCFIDTLHSEITKIKSAELSHNILAFLQTEEMHAFMFFLKIQEKIVNLR